MRYENVTSIYDIPWEIEFPGINFYDIQKQIILDDKELTGVFLGTGVGKTLTCLVLGRGRILIVCPKQQKLDETWQKNNEKFELGKDLTVVSKEEFRRDWDILPAFDTVIFDEGHNMMGVLPETRQRTIKDEVTKQKQVIQIPKASQLFEAAFMYLQKHPPTRFYIATATPASKPMNVWACAKLMGKNWDFFKFRQTFYFPTMMGRRQVWLPRTDEATRQRLAIAVQRLGYTGGLSDFMDVPEQTHIVEYIELTPEQKKAIKKIEDEEADPFVRRARLRTIENGVLYGQKVESISDREDRMVKDVTLFKNKKIDYILNRTDEFKKIFIFASFTAQVQMIADAIKESTDLEVRTVTGETKDRATVFEEMEQMDSGVVVVQAAICEGYRVPSAPCMIFASKSNRHVHYVQGLGRILDGQHLKKNLYIHLVVKDGSDEACHQSIMLGQDFQEKLSVL